MHILLSLLEQAREHLEDSQVEDRCEVETMHVFFLELLRNLMCLKVHVGHGLEYLVVNKNVLLHVVGIKLLISVRVLKLLLLFLDLFLVEHLHANLD